MLYLIVQAAATERAGSVVGRYLPSDRNLPCAQLYANAGFVQKTESEWTFASDRFAELDVIPSMQPYHTIDDGRWAVRAVGPERIKTTYAFKSLFDAGATVAFGSDWPVAPASPILGIYAAVTRRTIDDANPDGWIPEEKISVEQALTGYTRNAAYSSFDEDNRGSLESGKLADFVILDADLRKIAPENIKDVKVLQTFVGGKSVYKAQ